MDNKLLATGIALAIIMTTAIIYLHTAKYTYTANLEKPDQKLQPGKNYTAKLTLNNTGNRAINKIKYQIWSYPPHTENLPEPATNEIEKGKTADITHHIYTNLTRNLITLNKLNGMKWTTEQKIKPNEEWTQTIKLTMMEETPNQVQGRKLQLTANIKATHSKLNNYWIPMAIMTATGTGIITITYYTLGKDIYKATTPPKKEKQTWKPKEGEPIKITVEEIE